MGGGDGGAEGGSGGGESGGGTSALTRSNSARRSATAAIASEHPQVVGDGSGGGFAAPTLLSTQKATSNLSRRVHLVLGRRCWGLVCLMVCPGEWPNPNPVLRSEWRRRMGCGPGSGHGAV